MSVNSVPRKSYLVWWRWNVLHYGSIVVIRWRWNVFECGRDGIVVIQHLHHDIAEGVVFNWRPIINFINASIIIPARYSQNNLDDFFRLLFFLSDSANEVSGLSFLQNLSHT